PRECTNVKEISWWSMPRTVSTAKPQMYLDLDGSPVKGAQVPIINLCNRRKFKVSLFQKIINKEIKADIVYEDDLCLAFKDIHPQAPVHILMIPKKAIESIATLESADQSLIGHMLLKISTLAQQLGLSEKG